MDHQGYQRAAKHWQIKDAQNINMEHEQLLQAIDEYINQNNTCALATGAGDFVRCTPIEYAYHDHAFWMFSEGGEKFLALEKNPNVCLAIYDKYDGFGNLKGMQVSGTVEIVEPFSAEYNAAAEFKKIPLAALKQLPEPMNLLKVTPVRIDFLNSDFKKAGYASRQHLVF
jgi:nitroimidazol reductase NimA-like FMN-containing flavoprotein (pyridoxamine 5'-phosphate oxidase superfamily)